MNVVERIEHVPFVAGGHLVGVPRLCEDEGWESFSVAPKLTRAGLSAPVLGVDHTFRGCGIGGRPVEEAFAHYGGGRVDLISTAGAEGFYESLSH